MINISDENNMQRLIGRLEAEDKRNASIFKTFRILFLIFAVVYLFFGSIQFYMDLQIINFLGYVSYTIAFCIAFFLMDKHVNMFDRVDYSMPTLLMLKQARLRYRIFPSRATGLIIAVFLFLCLGQVLQTWGSIERFTYTMISVAVGLVIGLIIGCGIWVIRDKPLYDKFGELIHDLESNR